MKKSLFYEKIFKYDSREKGVKRGYTLKVLMLGWEFPPFFAGGAGIVCAELARSLNQKNVDITFLMPYGPEEVYKNISINETGKAKLKILISNNHVKASRIKIRKIKSLLMAYDSFESYDERYKDIINKIGKGAGKLYGKNLKEEVYRFAEQAKIIALEEEFDVIHAHDWTTFPAALAVKQATGKPLAIHVHITEFDKSGNQYADPTIYNIEKTGMEGADIVITVSNRVKQRCITQYGIHPDKIRVVHNAATPMNDEIFEEAEELKAGRKIVLFAGRVTMQKGPEFFVKAALKVSEKVPNVLFVVAGSGDKLPEMIDQVKAHGMEEKFMFTGFYTREQAEQLFSMADVFVMPSLSEPFGVVPYEAQMKKTPTIISKQSGISEVLKHTLKVDFWDTDQMANQIIALLHYGELHSEIQHNGYVESKNATWEEPATKCLNIYKEMISLKEQS